MTSKGETMKDTTKKRCDLLIENWEAIHKGFWLENGLITTVAAAAFTEKDRVADPEVLKECRKILRKKQGAFSELRGNNELIVTAKMALSADPEKYVDDVIAVYKKFQQGKFWDSGYRALAAMTICDSGRLSEADDIIDRTNLIMQGMNKAHMFLTSDEDTCFAVLLAMTDKSVEDILTELEETFQFIKKSFALHDNASYSLSQVLTSYDGSSEAKREKAVEYFDAFKEAGAKYGKNYELASIGTLIGLEGNMEEIVSEIVEVADYLKGNKGFKALDMSKQTRLMFGSMIVSGVNATGDFKTGASVVSGAVAIVVAEQVAMLVAIMAASSAHAASN